MIATAEEISTEPGTGGKGDALLQASRRVDWRFLLPEPELGHVAYVGPIRSALLESLRLFSASVTVIDTPIRYYQDGAQYEVVVSIGPSHEMLKHASSLVCSGGFLYVEACGVGGIKWVGRRLAQRLKGKVLGPVYPADYVASLAGMGFVQVQAHWHWPNFDSCTMMIPLDSPAALVHAFARTGRGVRRRLRAALGRALLRAGLLARLVPCFSVVARRGTS